jgi:energy-coupling factor transport system ATP-binding protein
MCADQDISKMTAQERLSFITMVPQNAADLLFLNTLADELAESDRFATVAPSTTATIFASLAGRVDPKRHPRDLSAGQQLALVLALQLVKGANVLLLDEPTRGLDYEAKRELAKQLAILKDQGKAVLLASHDIEFVAQVADRIVVLEKGRIVESGTPGEVLAFGKPLASQIAQIVQQPGAVCLSDIFEGDLTS